MISIIELCDTKYRNGVRRVAARHTNAHHIP